MKPKVAMNILLGVIALLLLYSSIFVVQQGQKALNSRLGVIITDASGSPKVFASGLHWKWPIIVSVRKFDTRLQNLESESPRILTKEQKYLYVDYFAKWKIDNLPLYYKRTGGLPFRAEQLLTQKINDSLRAEFGKKELHEVIADDRLQVMASLKYSANEGAKALGLNIVDVRIKSIDLLKPVQESVFQRMRTKREQVATAYRADGQAEGEKIRSQADAEAVKMIAEAKRKSAQIRAKGDSQAADVYTQSYSKDPSFYSLYRSLEAYRQVFSNKDTLMLLRPESEFLKYFNQHSAKSQPSSTKSSQ